MSKTASEYPVQAIYMTKAVLGGRATQLIGPCAGKSPPLTTRKSGVQDMMGGELLLCRKAFQLIAEDRNCSLKARDVRAW
jgi:predicted ABC-type transport system involved in lysophospholipase L1 biosynthesis ATPase subunit